MKKFIFLILFLTSCYTTNPYYNMYEWEPCEDPSIEEQEGEPHNYIEDEERGVI